MDERIPPPRDPVAAATHADPYPYYSRLVEERPFYFDDGLGCWVASSAAAVTAVLTSGLCRVRPPAEPVPAALAGSVCGALFGRLIRMNDGAARCPLKRAAVSAIDSIESLRVAQVTSDSARLLLGTGADLSSYCFRLPAYVMATLLGAGDDDRAHVAQWIGDLAGCFRPAGTGDRIARGEAAANRLVLYFRSLIADSRQQDGAGLLATLAREMHIQGCDDIDVAIANGIGFLWQSYEATAGLIGNTLVAMFRRVGTSLTADDDMGGMQGFVREVTRFDAPVQNTRRYVVERGSVLGEAVDPGDVVLALLAAANRDPRANPHPERFDARRKEPRAFTFGIGSHACPGETLATIIASTGAVRAIDHGADLKCIRENVRYHPSQNVRIPIFDR